MAWRTRSLRGDEAMEGLQREKESDSEKEKIHLRKSEEESRKLGCRGGGTVRKLTRIKMEVDGIPMVY
jgi:hypothetical protein